MAATVRADGPAVNGTVTNPNSGQSETVVQVFTDSNGEEYAVLTSAGNIIGTLLTPGESYQPTVGGNIYTIETVTTNTTTGLVDSINVATTTGSPEPGPYPPTTNPPATTATAVVSSGAAVAANQPQPSAPAVTPPTITSGVINSNYKGGGGSNGSNAYGLDILGVIIGKSGSNGGDGQVGPTIDLTVPSSYGTISSTGNNISGIIYGSSGGNGGSGGNSYGNIGPYSGGAGGSGGTVTLTNDTTISTAGTLADGIFAYSSSGSGGSGGIGLYFFRRRCRWRRGRGRFCPRHQ